MAKFSGAATLAGCMIVLLLVTLSSISLADQVMFIDVTNVANMEAESQFGVDVDGNTWILDIFPK